MEPTLGRIVMFRARQEIRGQTTIAAMITAIEPEGTVTLTGFPPGGGTPSHEKVPQGDADTPYSWYWPAGSSGAGGDFFGSGGGAPGTPLAPEGTTTTAPTAEPGPAIVS